MGDLYVLLTQRSMALKSFPGDTALPGGKADKKDRSAEETARREAFEEIGLPQDPLLVPHLCTLPPFLSANNLLVTPVIVLITSRALRPILNTPEVARLFAHPLLAFLSQSAPFSNAGEYHTLKDVLWASDPSSGPVRLHRFLTGREGEGIKPVFGLTAAILIRAAEVGYGRKAEFDVEAEGQREMGDRIGHVLKGLGLREEERVGRKWYLTMEKGENGRKGKAKL
ncbi:hypothetical protein DACRYDRAFT_73701 [Dacryopinax primogenitus]|uniref:Nudix hydrolase domain-containing protein n=1 Tax=Dacryopinax primogenitus (strain DJM 731) TaxID=1858805 RepID=M5G7X3_DACPD|nr:uncharacterized protein DACRYDRAFT_73701 [Dacryopinax primogenitus]EJU06306.1 hypothetical protein DACRYDRAFT_73701 [Dacryopinax primogenitus]